MFLQVSGYFGNLYCVSSKEKISEIQNEAISKFKSALNSKDLYDLKVQFLGKQGSLSLLMRDMGKLSNEEKPVFGKWVNEAKQVLETEYALKEESLRKAELLEKLSRESIDIGLPGTSLNLGTSHPIAIVIDEIATILSRIGYSIRTGPQIERDWYNFEALNIPQNHPARDMQDTFYIDKTHVLRTHTSPIQIHSLENETPPLRVIGVGPVYRCDSDISHSPNFHQIEGMLVDKKASMADLRGTVAYFVREFFGKNLKTRFRPSFFPFTEPSAEVDCSCPICSGKGCRMCKDSGWIEIGGCGLINPNVFHHAKVKYPEWQGFAFGFGIERMAIIKYGIDDIRLFSDNDPRFLRQFPI